MRGLRGAMRYILIFAMTLLLGSCGSSLSQKLSIEGYENLSIMGMSGAKIDVGVRNESGHKVKVKELQLRLRDGGKTVAVAILKGEVEIARRTPYCLYPTLWQFDEVNPIAAIALSRKIFDNDLSSSLVVDIEGRAKVGLATRNFEERNVPLRGLLQSVN